MLAAFSIASSDAIEHLVLDRGLDLHLRQEIDHVLGAAVQLGVALLPAEALHLGHGDALHADPERASRTSSSLNGLMIAVTSFIC